MQIGIKGARTVFTVKNIEKQYREVWHTMTQLFFDFSKTLTDADGDKVIIDTLSDTQKEIQKMLNCSKTKAFEVLADLQKKYDVFSGLNQIVLAHENKVLYNFEKYGETVYNGHKYNATNEWDFKDFVEGKKIKAEKKRFSRSIKLTCTEKQLKRAAQLQYAHSIGFDIGYNDYKRFYLV